MKRTLLLSLWVIGLAFSAEPFCADVRGDLATLNKRQEQLNISLKQVSPALVAVQDGFGAGSGVIVSADGIVLTASHVVDSRRRRSPRLSVVFSDGSTYRCKLLGMNRSADAAMLKITEPYRQGPNFPFVELGESGKLQRGDWCFALGHPGGFRQERPAPVRLGRVLSVGDRTVVSDCAIVLGDSGGPLFDLSGKLIGIHSMITEVIVENRHVAIDVFRRDGDRMEAGETWGILQSEEIELAESPFFGTYLRWRDFTPEVSRVIRDSPADKAGIRPGDILLNISNQAFADPLELSALLVDLAEDQNVDVKVERGGRDRTLKMTTGRHPDERQRLEMEANDNITEEDEEHDRELKNQLTSFRRVGPYEKRSTEEMDRFDSVIERSRGCTVEFRELGRTLSLGTVMSRDGYILTKASELQNAVDPEVILPNGRRARMKELATDYEFDLMLVKVDTNSLAPPEWATEALPVGRILVTSDARGTPLLPGVVSVAARKLPTASKGFLGVQLGMQGNPVHVVLKNILPGGAAQRNGLQEGDVILAINGRDIIDTRHMAETVGSFPPNARISIRFQRQDTVRTMDIVLTPQFVAEDGDAMLGRYSDPRNLGKFASAHNSGFPEAIQHDTDLYPNQCGGPIFDISGKAVGINVARAGRINSYAIPASAVLRVFGELLNKANEKPARKAS